MNCRVKNYPLSYAGFTLALARGRSYREKERRKKINLIVRPFCQTERTLRVRRNGVRRHERFHLHKVFYHLQERDVIGPCNEVWQTSAHCISHSATWHIQRTFISLFCFVLLNIICESSFLEFRSSSLYQSHLSFTEITCLLLLDVTLQRSHIFEMVASFRV